MGTTQDLKDKAAEKAQAQSPATTTTEAPRKTILEWLRDPAQQAQIAAALPSVIPADHFIRMVTTVIKHSPDLQVCTTTSLLGACMHAASLGLEPGPLEHCYFLPFRDNKANEMRVQFILGYKGMIELARRSGQLSGTVEVMTVRQGDDYEFELGLEPILRHRPAEVKGETICYWGLARFVEGGFYMREVWPWEIDEHRARSSAPNSPAWRNDFDSMAHKTVVRIMWPLLPKSTQMARAVQTDGAVIASFDQVRNDAVDTTAQDVTAQDRAEEPPPAGESPPADRPPSDESTTEPPKDGDAAGEKADEEFDAGRCLECKWDLPNHADGCSFDKTKTSS